MNRQAERVIGDLKDVVKDTKDLVTVTTADLVDKAQAVGVQLRKAVRATQNTCEELQDRAVAGGKVVAKSIRTHPWQAAGIGLAALAIGWLIVWSRR